MNPFRKFEAWAQPTEILIPLLSGTNRIYDTDIGPVHITRPEVQKNALGGGHESENYNVRTAEGRCNFCKVDAEVVIHR